MAVTNETRLRSVPRRCQYEICLSHGDPSSRLLHRECKALKGFSHRFEESLKIYLRLNGNIAPRGKDDLRWFVVVQTDECATDRTASDIKNSDRTPSPAPLTLKQRQAPILYSHPPPPPSQP